jgi:4Fe-4S ferredoxin
LAQWEKVQVSENKCLDKNRPGVVRPVVDFNRCEGKDDCAKVCPYDVFDVRKIDRSDYRALSFMAKFKNRIHGGRVAYTPNAEQCRACGLCVKACPERAIKLVKAHATDQ